MKGSGKEEEKVVTVYVLSINRFANELMPYIIISPAHQNIISNQSSLRYLNELAYHASALISRSYLSCPTSSCSYRTRGAEVGGDCAGDLPATKKGAIGPAVCAVSYLT